jgi:4-hydroxy-tetrahydrodipicolinate synthase
MAFRELDRPIRGIIPPVVTPLAGPDRLDETGLERLLEHLIGGGVHGLFILGSCGEGPSLSHRLRRELVERTCTIVEDRLPVLVGITDIEQAELVAYLQRLASDSPLPVTLYNMPSLTGVNFALESVQQLIDVPAIVGIKDSSGDLDYFRDLRTLARQRDDWSVLIGQEHLLTQALELGADGGVCGGANVWPQAFVQLYEATLATTETTIAEQGDVLPHLVDQADRLAQIYRVAGEAITAPSVINGLKAALAAMGITTADVAEPLQPLSAADQRHVESILGELGLPLGLRAHSI